MNAESGQVLEQAVVHTLQPQPFIAGVLLLAVGFQSTSALPSPTTVASSRSVESTTAGRPAAPARRPGAAIAELRRLSGLTWEQLADLFGTSRRAVHFWASGKAMSAGNEAKLAHALGVMKKVDRGSASVNRRLLFAPARDGSVPVDLLRDGEYDRVVEMIGISDVVRRRPTPPSPAMMAARLPRPPADLVDARQDPVDVPSGRLLGATPLPDHRGG